MKIWILLLIAGLLLAWSLYRERFEATSTIKAPPYSDDEKRRIYGMLSSTSQNRLIAKAMQDNPSIRTDTTSSDAEKRRRLETAAASYVTPAVGDFFTSVYTPGSTTLTESTVNTFMESRTGDLKPIEKEAIIAYFLNQAGIASSGYLDLLAREGQTYQYQTRGTGATGTTATGATGGTGATGTTATGATGGTSTTTGTTAGGTTGGSSNTSAAPNAGPVGASTGRGQSVFGPVFTELGAPVDGGNGKDSSKTNKYPELLGGVGDTTSVRTPNGIQGPSQNWLLSQSGALPSTASLGSGNNSMFLPYSRTPGDQDLIPDPYRLSRNYSTASYSSKTDPVPFLTDFSAFFK